MELPTSRHFCGGPKKSNNPPPHFWDRENEKETHIVFYPIKPNMQKSLEANQKESCQQFKTIYLINIF